ncbi:MAG: hypothetical protein HQL25_03785 [Candidatus Omnitrophica bacterium]|nr:hypothetical protein [Candidatus Omnitrophota bacterium]
MFRSIYFKSCAITVLIAFLMTTVFQTTGFAQVAMYMPAVGTQVMPSAFYEPASAVGMQVDPVNPFHFNFFIDRGQDPLAGEIEKTEYKKLVKYFLAALTIPDKNQWVNLSPYEHNRIVPTDFGDTEMGRDLLAQDYLLKQLTSSLMYPEKEIGKVFWDKIYEKVYAKYGQNAEVPVNTFNKVWITPDKAVVYEDGDKVWIMESHLKIMLEQDYMALDKNKDNSRFGLSANNNTNLSETSTASSQIVREIIVPAIEKEVNTGKNFALLRQVYKSMILSAWFKKRLKDHLLSQVYKDKDKVIGVNLDDKQANEKIYQQYIESFKTGVFDYIKEEYDPASQTVIPRKYFAGGGDFAMLTTDIVNVVTPRSATPAQRATFAEAVKGLDGRIDILSALFTENDREAIAATAKYKKALETVQAVLPPEVIAHLKQSIIDQLAAEDVNFSERQNAIEAALVLAVAQWIDLNNSLHRKDVVVMDKNGKLAVVSTEVLFKNTPAEINIDELTSLVMGGIRFYAHYGDAGLALANNINFVSAIQAMNRVEERVIRLEKETDLSKSEVLISQLEDHYDLFRKYSDLVVKNQEQVENAFAGNKQVIYQSVTIRQMFRSFENNKYDLGRRSGKLFQRIDAYKRTAKSTSRTSTASSTTGTDERTAEQKAMDAWTVAISPILDSKETVTPEKLNQLAAQIADMVWAQLTPDQQTQLPRPELEGKLAAALGQVLDEYQAKPEQKAEVTDLKVLIQKLISILFPQKESEPATKPAVKVVDLIKKLSGFAKAGNMDESDVQLFLGLLDQETFISLFNKYQASAIYDAIKFVMKNLPQVPDEELVKAIVAAIKTKIEPAGKSEEELAAEKAAEQAAAAAQAVKPKLGIWGKLKAAVRNGYANWAAGRQAKAELRMQVKAATVTWKEVARTYHLDYKFESGTAGDKWVDQLMVLSEIQKSGVSRTDLLEVVKITLNDEFMKNRNNLEGSFLYIYNEILLNIKYSILREKVFLQYSEVINDSAENKVEAVADNIIETFKSIGSSLEINKQILIDNIKANIAEQQNTIKSIPENQYDAVYNQGFAELVRPLIEADAAMVVEADEMTDLLVALEQRGIVADEKTIAEIVANMPEVDEQLKDYIGTDILAGWTIIALINGQKESPKPAVTPKPAEVAPSARSLVEGRINKLVGQERVDVFFGYLSQQPTYNLISDHNYSENEIKEVIQALLTAGKEVTVVGVVMQLIRNRQALIPEQFKAFVNGIEQLIPNQYVNRSALLNDFFDTKISPQNKEMLDQLWAAFAAEPEGQQMGLTPEEAKDAVIKILLDPTKTKDFEEMLINFNKFHSEVFAAAKAERAKLPQKSEKLNQLIDNFLAQTKSVKDFIKDNQTLWNDFINELKNYYQGSPVLDIKTASDVVEYILDMDSAPARFKEDFPAFFEAFLKQLKEGVPAVKAARTPEEVFTQGMEDLLIAVQAVEKDRPGNGVIVITASRVKNFLPYYMLTDDNVSTAVVALRKFFTANKAKAKADELEKIKDLKFFSLLGKFDKSEVDVQKQNTVNVVINAIISRMEVIDIVAQKEKWETKDIISERLRSKDQVLSKSAGVELINQIMTYIQEKGMQLTEQEVIDAIKSIFTSAETTEMEGFKTNYLEFYKLVAQQAMKDAAMIVVPENVTEIISLLRQLWDGTNINPSDQDIKDVLESMTMPAGLTQDNDVIVGMLANMFLQAQEAGNQPAGQPSLSNDLDGLQRSVNANSKTWKERMAQVGRWALGATGLGMVVAAVLGAIGFFKNVQPVAPEAEKPAAERTFDVSRSNALKGAIKDGLTGNNAKKAVLDSLKDRYAESGTAFQPAKVDAKAQGIADAQFDILHARNSDPMLGKSYTDVDGKKHEGRNAFKTFLRDAKASGFFANITEAFWDGINGLNEDQQKEFLAEMAAIQGQVKELSDGLIKTFGAELAALQAEGPNKENQQRIQGLKDSIASLKEKNDESPDAIVGKSSEYWLTLNRLKELAEISNKMGVVANITTEALVQAEDAGTTKSSPGKAVIFSRVFEEGTTSPAKTAAGNATIVYDTQVQVANNGAPSAYKYVAGAGQRLKGVFNSVTGATYSLLDKGGKVVTGMGKGLKTLAGVKQTTAGPVTPEVSARLNASSKWMKALLAQARIDINENNFANVALADAVRDRPEPVNVGRTNPYGITDADVTRLLMAVGYMPDQGLTLDDMEAIVHNGSDEDARSLYEIVFGAHVVLAGNSLKVVESFGEQGAVTFETPDIVAVGRGLVFREISNPGKSKKEIQKRVGAITPAQVRDALLEAIKEERAKRPADRAMFIFGEEISFYPQDDPVGGIDMDSAMLNLQIKRDPNGVPLPMNFQDPAMMQNLKGLMPVIMDITNMPSSMLPNLSAAGTAPNQA